MQLTISHLKKIAKYFTKKHKQEGINAHYSTMLEDMAKALDYDNYNTLKVILEDVNEGVSSTCTIPIPSCNWLNLKKTILIGKEEFKREAKRFNVISEIQNWEANVAVMGVTGSGKSLFTQYVVSTLIDPNQGERRQVIIFDTSDTYDFQDKKEFVVVDPSNDIFVTGEESLFSYCPYKLYQEDKNVVFKVNTFEEGRGKFIKHIIEEIADEQYYYSNDLIVVFDNVYNIFDVSENGWNYFDEVLRLAKLSGMVIWAVSPVSHYFSSCLHNEFKVYNVFLNKQMLEIDPRRGSFNNISDSFLSPS